MKIARQKPRSLRDRKREATRRKIVESGLALFMEHGFEATTLDMIAAEAGISRRTFFHYFKTKDAVLLARVGNGFPEDLRAAMLKQSADQPPLFAARNCFTALASRYETKDAAVVDRLLNSTEALRASKNALFLEIEEVLFETMCDLWPDRARRSTLRIIAMAASGALRLALEARRDDDGRHPLEDYIRRTFEILAASL